MLESSLNYVPDSVGNAITLRVSELVKNGFITVASKVGQQARY